MNPSPRLEIAYYINDNTVGNQQNAGTDCVVNNNELHCLLDALKKKREERKREPRSRVQEKSS